MTRLVLLVTLSLLTSVATAYAECAWMLWQEFSTIENARGLVTEWSIVVSEDSFGNCNRMIRDATRDRAEKWKNAAGGVKIQGNQVKIGGIEGKTAPIIYRYLCLPDTVDPRGPKAK